jgi:hypothetical protein
LSRDTGALAIDDCDSEQPFEVLLVIGGVVMLSVLSELGEAVGKAVAEPYGIGRNHDMMQRRVRDTTDDFSTPPEHLSILIINEQPT